MIGKSNYWNYQPTRKQQIKELYNRSIETGWFSVIYMGSFVIFTTLMIIFAEDIAILFR